MGLGKRTLVYFFILLIYGGAVAFAMIRDFADTPWPPDLALEEFEPATAAPLKENKIWKPKFPVIDIHSHPRQSGMTADEMIKVMDESGVQAVVDLDGRWGRNGERLKRVIEQYHLKYPDRLLAFFAPDLFKLGEKGFVEKECEKIEQAAKMGVKGIKIYKQFGTLWRDKSGQRIAVDDARLDPIWQKIGELGLPVVIHTANPVAFWEPTDRFNERYEELHQGGAWLESYYDKPQMPSHEQLMQERENLMRKHPNTIFIGAHMAALGHDLKSLAKTLDEFPNFYVEISDRVYELGRQPYTTRDFFIKYQDRLLFGIDYIPETEVYRDYFRFFETYDEYFDYPRREFKHGRWKIYGIGLPDSVLKKVYLENVGELLQIEKQK